MSRSKNFWLDKAEAGLLWLSVFLLPWQLRHTVMFASVNGGYFEYGSWHIYATDLVIVALLALWAMRPAQFTYGPRWLQIPLLLWLGWLTMSMAWALDKPLAAIVAAHWWLAYGWYLYLLNRVKHLSQLLNPLLWGMGLQAGWGIAQYLFNHSLGLNWLGESVLDPTQAGIPVVASDGIRQLRAHGMLPHANIFGGLLAAFLPALIFYWQTIPAKTTLRRWAVLVIVLVAVGLGLSFARGAWLVGIGGLLIGLTVAWRHRRWRKWAVAWLALVMFGLTLASQYQFVANRFDLTNALEQRSVSERVLGLSQWEAIAGRYMTRGTGIGGYTLATQMMDETQPAWWYQPVHNLYLLTIGELGVIGVAILGWLIVGLIIWQVKRLWHSPVWLLALPMNGWLALGLVDHWPVSLQQGRLLLFLALVLLILAGQVSLSRTATKL